MSRFTLSPAAEVDLLEIDLQTIQRFGFAQSEVTESKFYATFQALAAEPLSGHAREDLDPPGRSFLYKSVLRRFVVVYLPAEYGIRVVRVVDGSRGLRRVLLESNDDDEPPA